MTWLTWRQQRTETLIAILVLVLVAALLVPTGLRMASVYDTEGIAACLTTPSEGCSETLDSFASRWDTLMRFVGWLNVVPALLGALLAAPLVLEFERGTFRLAWTQSITRRRWLAVRIAMIVGGAIVASVLFMLLTTWWRAPLDDVSGRFSEAFDLEGLVPSAYTLFAAALVIALGVLLRRAAPAIGLAFVAFLAVRIGIANWARPNYRDPIVATWPGEAGVDLRGAWVFNQGGEFRTEEGVPPDPALVQACVSNAPTRSFDEACLADQGIEIYSHATYHPESRFWPFQAIEAGMFVAMAIVLLAFSVWWIRRRIS